MLVATMLITRCALTLAVLALLALPFTFASPLSLSVDLLGMLLSLSLVALSAGAARWLLRRGYQGT